MKRELTLLLLSLIVSTKTLGQWQIVNSTFNLFAVDFINDSTGLVVHNMIDGSYILKTIDYGVTFDTVAIYPPTEFFDDVVFASDSVAYACGQSSIFLKSLDGGETWFDPNESPDPNFTSLFFINDTLGYGVHFANGIGVTTDGASTWLMFEDYSGRDLHFFEDCSGGSIVGTGYFTTSNCSGNWNDATLNTINRTWNTLWMLNSDEIFIGATGGFGTYFDFNYGSIGKSTDGGETFEILDFPYTDSVIDLFFIDDQTGYASCDPQSGYQYSILKTEDGGDTWGYQEIDFAPGSESYTGIKEIDCPSPGYCYAVGAGIYRTTNGGGEIHEAWVEVGVDSPSIQSPELILAPNPASESITLRSNDLRSRVEISIYNVFGQIVLNQQVLFTNSLELPIADLASGQYFVLVESEKKILHQKFVKE